MTSSPKQSEYDRKGSWLSKPVSPSKSDLVYCDAMEEKIWEWKSETLSSKTLTFNEVKEKFMTMSPVIINFALQFMVDKGRLANEESSARSRNAGYTISEEQWAVLVEMKETKDTLETLVQDSKEYEKAAEKENEKERERATKKKRAVPSSPIGEGKENMIFSGPNTSMPPRSAGSGTSKPKKAKASAASAIYIPNSEEAEMTAPAEHTHTHTQAAQPQVELRVGLDSPQLSKLMPAPLASDEVTEVLLMALQGQDEGMTIADVRETMEMNPAMQAEGALYNVLENLCDANRVMVDWQDGDDKESSVIYQL